MNTLRPKALCSAIALSSLLIACSPATRDESTQADHPRAESPVVLIEPASSTLPRPRSPDTPVMTDMEYRTLPAPVGTALHGGDIAQESSSASFPSPSSFSPARAVYPSPSPRPDPRAGELYAPIEDGGVQFTSHNPVSTFSIDVDTGAYSNVRRFLNSGHLPPRDAVRTEELINYFSYDYGPAADSGHPFIVSTELSASPWHPQRQLLQIGLQAQDVQADILPASNLVFLVDVSGSMQADNKLGLLKTSLKMLLNQLGSEDRVAIVTYAGNTAVVLESTPGNERAQISAAIDRLSAGGGTNGGAGIELAYAQARQGFIEGGINRVILATDGDFNVGMVDFEALIGLVSDRRKHGIGLTTLGFGSGNYNDHLMEQLAGKGNGNYAYIDNLNEARKVLVDQRSATLHTVASDVKIQIEFNPAVVSEYRLIGYENRALAREDFNNDRVDAGEIGAGHRVTALYELTLAGSEGQSVDPLRYAGNRTRTEPATADQELAYLKLRYKPAAATSSVLLEYTVKLDRLQQDINRSSDNYRFAAAVAGFGQLLRANPALHSFDYDDVLALAQGARGEDEFGYRSEFINLVKTTQALSL